MSRKNFGKGKGESRRVTQYCHFLAEYFYSEPRLRLRRSPGKNYFNREGREVHEEGKGWGEVKVEEERGSSFVTPTDHSSKKEWKYRNIRNYVFFKTSLEKNVVPYR